MTVDDRKSSAQYVRRFTISTRVTKRCRHMHGMHAGIVALC